MTLTSINLVISCTFSLFLSLKASRASLYSFSCDKLKKKKKPKFSGSVLHFSYQSKATCSQFGIGKVSPSSGRYALMALILCLLYRSSYALLQLPSSWDLLALQAPASSMNLFEVRKNNFITTYL